MKLPIKITPARDYNQWEPLAFRHIMFAMFGLPALAFIAYTVARLVFSIP